jgi:hypothetical protein
LPHACRKPQKSHLSTTSGFKRFTVPATSSCTASTYFLELVESSYQPTKEDKKEMEKLKEAETVAAQRLRKTFKYPSESDDEDAVEAGMDEQGTCFPPPCTPPMLN